MGTQPTNAGIDFQQRVSAWYLINLLFEIELSQFFEINNSTNMKIVQIAFESDQPIDDLLIRTDTGVSFFLQMKRSVSFSLSKESDFYSTFDQFVRQFAQKTKNEEYYVLVTGPGSSSRVTKVLKKILYAIRLNPSYFIENPLNKTEKDIYDKFKQLIEDLYFKHNSIQISSEVFIELSKKIIIQSLDMEEGGYSENAAIMYLLPHCKIPPRLIWSHLIKSALSFASQRLTINKEGIRGLLRQYLKINSDETEQKSNETENILSFVESDVSMARDVVIVEWEDEQNKNSLCIMELVRFNEDGSKRYLFSPEGYLTLKNGMKFKVIHRCSTQMGAERYFEENVDKYKNYKIILAPANIDIQEEENQGYVVMRRQWYIDAMRTALNKGMYCIYCGKAISENKQYMIEIDIGDSETGLSHRECIKSIDRVTGLIESEMFEEYQFLKKFDYQKWTEAIENSQTGLYQMLRLNNKVPVRVLWDPFAEYIYEFDYCIKDLMEDDSISYIHDRGRVLRLNKSNAKKKAKEFNQYLEKHRKMKDPLCYTSIHYIFGPYSQLLQMKEPDEKVIEILSVEVTKYNEQIGKMHNHSRNYYAPIIIIKLNGNDEKLLEYYGRVIMISNPLELGSFLGNWNKAGLIVEDYELIILVNDMEFDSKMRQIFESGSKAIIDPLLDQQGRVIKGLLLESQYELLKRNTKH